MPQEYCHKYCAEWGIMALEYHFDHQGNIELQGTHKRSYCWLYFLLFILAQIGVGVWLYVNGYLTPVDSENNAQVLSLGSKLNGQEQQLKLQAEKIVRLESQFISARRSEKIQQTANEVLREKLGAAETALGESRERLLLYEEILSPESLKRGLDVRHLDIQQLVIDSLGKKLAHDRYYKYHLILTNIRGGNGDPSVSGTFSLKLIGKKNSKKVTLTLADIMVKTARGKGGQSGNKFSLKYYQGLEGKIALPEHFVPEQVVVELRPNAKKAGKKVTKKYDWNAVKRVIQSPTNEE